MEEFYHNVCIYREREVYYIYIYVLTCPHFRHIPSSKEPAGNGLLWLRRQSCTTSQESAAKCCKSLANSHLWSAEFTKSGNLRRNTSKHSTHRPGNGQCPIQKHQATEAAKSLCRIWWGYGPGPEAQNSTEWMAYFFCKEVHVKMKRVCLKKLWEEKCNV